MKIKNFVMSLFITWTFISPIWIMITYAHGWNKGFTACSTVWTEQIDSYIARLGEQK